MVDVKQGGLIHILINAVLHHMLGGSNSQVHVQDQIIQSRNYCYSSIRMISIDKEKKQQTKDNQMNI